MRNTANMPMPSMSSNERIIAEVKKLRKTIIGLAILLITGLLIYSWYNEGFSLPDFTKENPRRQDGALEIMEKGAQRMRELRAQYPDAGPNDLVNMMIKEDSDKAHKK